MNKIVQTLIILAFGSSICYGAENSNSELVSMLSIYTASVEDSMGERLSVAVVRQDGKKAALYRCTKAFLGTAGNQWKVLEFFANHCLAYKGFENYKVQKNYLTNRQGTRISVVFSGTGSLLQPNTGELFSDVTTYSTKLYNGLGVSIKSIVLLVGSRITHLEREEPQMSTYRLTFFHAASVGFKNHKEIKD